MDTIIPFALHVILHFDESVGYNARIPDYD